MLIKLEERLCVVLLIAIVALVFVAAVMRSMGMPVIWSVDFAQLFFAWLIMLGANQTLRKAEHVGVDMLVRNLPWRTQVKIDLVLYLLVLMALVALLVFGIKLTLLNPQRALGTTSFSYSWVTAALPAGAGLMLITMSRQWWDRLDLLRTPLDDANFSKAHLQKYQPKADDLC
ncbi:TRAP transporter small permease subunit [Alteromonadaceae bacterium BrNp21-10]|nr:TRAP transporter small permease subunit [Alteromonadaceae bacterium BrNp21-10]